MTSTSREGSFGAARRGWCRPKIFLPWLPLELERRPRTVSRRETTRRRVRRGLDVIFVEFQACQKKLAPGAYTNTRHVSCRVMFILHPAGVSSRTTGQRGGQRLSNLCSAASAPAAVCRISAARRKTKRCRSASERVEGCGSSEDQRRKPVKGARALGRAPQCSWRDYGCCAAASRPRTAPVAGRRPQ